MTHADIPTTDDVRDIWVDYHLNPLPRVEGIALVPEYQAAFDVWLGTIRADERAVLLADLIAQVEMLRTVYASHGAHLALRDALSILSEAGE